MVGQVQRVTLDCKLLRISWNRVGVLFLSMAPPNLPLECSARRIIRNLFITLAAMVSPTDRRRCELLRLPSSLFDLRLSANVIPGFRLHDLYKQQTGASF